MKLSDKPRQLGVAFAQNGTKNTLPAQSSQSTKEKGIATYDSGFPPVTMTAIAAGGIPPQGNDFNGVLNDITAAIRYGQAGSLYTFDTAFAAAIGGYPGGALVLSSDTNKIWWNTVDGNSSDPDSAQAAGWVRLADRTGLYLESAKNLSDVQNVNAARNNLGLGDLATKDGLTAADVGAADSGVNFAAKMGKWREINGDKKPAYPGVWSVGGSKWTPESWGTLIYTTNQIDLNIDTGSGKYHHYIFVSHSQRIYTATNVNGNWSGWQRPIDSRGDTMTGKLTVPQLSAFGVATENALGSPSIAIGDTDTGFKQNGDGVLDVYANNQQVMRFEPGQITSQRSVQYTSSGGPVGSGSFADQLTNDAAPFVQKNWNWTPNVGGHYVPIVKGLSTRAGVGYPSAVSFGYLLSGNNGFAIPCIHMRGDGNNDVLWQFNPNDKTLYAPGEINANGARFTADGNIAGDTWGGWLSEWLNNQFTARDNNINTRATWDYVNNDNTPTYNAANRGAIDGRIQWWMTAQGPGNIGSYALLRCEDGFKVPGDIVGGDRLVYSSAGTHFGGNPPGNWRAMGRSFGGGGQSGDEVTLWLRIS